MNSFPDMGDDSFPGGMGGVDPVDDSSSDELNLSGSDSGGGFSPAMGFAGLGGVLGAYGNITAGNNQAAILERQAGLQTQYAGQALQAGSYNAYRQSILANRTLGAAKASYGASGVDSTSGSVMSVIGASAANAEIDRQNILYGAQIRATNYENQASIENIEAGEASQSGTLGAVGQLLGSAGSMVAIAAFA